MRLFTFLWACRVTCAGWQLDACHVPKDSPLRNAHLLFWGIRTNDEGAYRPNGFHGLVHAGQIQLVAPTRVIGFGGDGRSLMLQDGKTQPADVVILATGYSSSWSKLFDGNILFVPVYIAMAKVDSRAYIRWIRYKQASAVDENNRYLELRFIGSSTSFPSWQWAVVIFNLPWPRSCKKPPPAWFCNKWCCGTSFHHITPKAYLIVLQFTTNNGYTYEVSAHWISSYFLKDKMRLPSSAEEALVSAERNSAWMRKRYPDMLVWVNESYSSSLAFWSYVTPDVFPTKRWMIDVLGGHKRWMISWMICTYAACGAVEIGWPGLSRSLICRRLWTLERSGVWRDMVFHYNSHASSKDTLILLSNVGQYWSYVNNVHNGWMFWFSPDTINFIVQDNCCYILLGM